MDLAQGLGRIWTIPSGFAASSCTGGSWTPRNSKRYTAKAADQGYRQRLRSPVLRECRRLDTGSQHVRANSRSMERRFVERVVGRQSPVPHACLCAHASRAAYPHDGRRHHVPLRHRRTGGRSKESQRSSQRQRCPNRRRCLRHSPISNCESDRRNACGHVTRPPRRRRASLLRNQSVQPWLHPRQNRLWGKRNSRPYRKEIVVLA